MDILGGNDGLSLEELIAGENAGLLEFDESGNASLTNLGRVFAENNTTTLDQNTFESLFSEEDAAYADFLFRNLGGSEDTGISIGVLNLAIESGQINISDTGEITLTDEFQLLLDNILDDDKQNISQEKEDAAKANGLLFDDTTQTSFALTGQLALTGIGKAIASGENDSLTAEEFSALLTPESQEFSDYLATVLGSLDSEDGISASDLLEAAQSGYVTVDEDGNVSITDEGKFLAQHDIDKDGNLNQSELEAVLPEDQKAYAAFLIAEIGGRDGEPGISAFDLLTGQNQVNIGGQPQPIFFEIDHENGSISLTDHAISLGSADNAITSGDDDDSDNLNSGEFSNIVSGDNTTQEEYLFNFLSGLETDGDPDSISRAEINVGQQAGLIEIDSSGNVTLTDLGQLMSAADADVSGTLSVEEIRSALPPGSEHFAELIIETFGQEGELTIGGVNSAINAGFLEIDGDNFSIPDFPNAPGQNALQILNALSQNDSDGDSQTFTATEFNSAFSPPTGDSQALFDFFSDGTTLDFNAIAGMVNNGLLTVNNDGNITLTDTGAELLPSITAINRAIGFDADDDKALNSDEFIESMLLGYAEDEPLDIRDQDRYEEAQRLQGQVNDLIEIFGEDGKLSHTTLLSLEQNGIINVDSQGKISITQDGKDLIRAHNTVEQFDYNDSDGLSYNELTNSMLVGFQGNHLEEQEEYARLQNIAHDLIGIFGEDGELSANTIAALEKQGLIEINNQGKITVTQDGLDYIDASKTVDRFDYNDSGGLSSNELTNAMLVGFQGHHLEEEEEYARLQNIAFDLIGIFGHEGEISPATLSMLESTGIVTVNDQGKITITDLGKDTITAFEAVNKFDGNDDDALSVGELKASMLHGFDTWDPFEEEEESRYRQGLAEDLVQFFGQDGKISGITLGNLLNNGFITINNQGKIEITDTFRQLRPEINVYNNYDDGDGNLTVNELRTALGTDSQYANYLFDVAAGDDGVIDFSDLSQLESMGLININSQGKISFTDVGKVYAQHDSNRDGFFQQNELTNASNGTYRDGAGDFYTSYINSVNQHNSENPGDNIPNHGIPPNIFESSLGSEVGDLRIVNNKFELIPPPPPPPPPPPVSSSRAGH